MRLDLILALFQLQVNQVLVTPLDLQPQPLALSLNLNLSKTQATNFKGDDVNHSSSTHDGNITNLNDESQSSIPVRSQSVAPLVSPSLSSSHVTGLSSIPSPCHVAARCTSNAHPVTCYDAQLPYSSTGPSLLKPNTSLSQWAGLQDLPGCWAVLQPLLCAAHHPSCDLGLADRVPRSLCRAAQKPCKVLRQILDIQPEFLDCSNDLIFSDECSEDKRSKRAKFNSSRSCVWPLLHTRVSSAYFPDIDECGLQCQSPLLSESEYSILHTTVTVTATVSFLCSLVTVLTFCIDWQGGGKHPARAAFFLNSCLLVVAAGWLVPAIPGWREDIVCRRDGTVRQGEPGENLGCAVVFVMVYYFSIAGAVWLVIFAYSWSVYITATPMKAREVLAGRDAYFHMAAWSLPLVLTILVMATNKVDGSAMSGICYVGYTDHVARGFFVLAPHIVAILVAGFFTRRAVTVLYSLCYGAGSAHLKEMDAKKMKLTLLRIVVFSVLVTICVAITTATHAYRWLREAGWDLAVQKLVFCNLRSALSPKVKSECALEDRPSLAVLHLELLPLFCAGVLASSWVWTRESINTWTFGLKQILCRKKNQRPVKLRKHEIIAQAFSKRNELQANGRLSLSFQSAHDDPLGLDLQADTSGDFSSGWAAALPHLVTRRVGLCGAAELGLARRGSLESVSNISRSVSIKSGRSFWFGSRKGSLDSQDIQQSDLDRLQSIYDKTIKKNRSKREFFRSHRQKLRPWSRLSSRRTSLTSRAGSDNSSLASQVLPAITLTSAQLGNTSTTTTTKLSKISVPEPGRSIDFGNTGIQLVPEIHPELEERLRQLATVSRNTMREGEAGNMVEVAVQADLPLAEVARVSIGTQVSPKIGHKKSLQEIEGTPLPPLLPPASSVPLQHVEANVVNIKVLGPSSEDSSIPSSYEKDFKMKKLNSRGKENQGGELRLDVEEMTIPALKTLPRDSGGHIRPRDHYNRGRRGAIVHKRSPEPHTDTTTDS